MIRMSRLWRAAACGWCVLALAGCGSGTAASSDPAPSGPALPSSHDWLRFNYDVNRSGASPDPTGITAAGLTSLQRQRVQLEGTVDSSPIYLHGVEVKGGVHNAFFVTTTYGKTIAIDADTGAVLWTYTPQEFDTWAGTARITTATPVADNSRQFVYAASPDGHVQKLAVAAADGAHAIRA